MPQNLTLPTFDWENLIPDPATRHALQDYAVQINSYLENLQEQIDELEDTDTGVPPHNLLQSDVHLDTITDDPSPGSVIVGTPADSVDLGLFWFKGLPCDFLNTELATGGCRFWFKGLPFDAVSSLSDGDVKWEEFEIGPDGYVLTSRGASVEWAEASALLTRVTVSAYLTADVAIADSTLTSLSFGAVEFDSGPFWSSSAPSRLTVPANQAGKFVAVGQAAWAVGTLGALRVVLLKNGVSVAVVEGAYAVTEATPRQQVAKLLDLAVGDYVQLAVYWDYSDSATRTINQGADDTFLQLVRVN